jgi:hypothetical protein
MSALDPARLAAHRAETFRLDRPVTSPDEAVAFVAARGFVTFWPITGLTLPSLWTAVAGDRPVAKQHNDPGHVTWGWKDALLSARKWYYAKVIRGKATMIAPSLSPHFYALSENMGDPERDYLELYRAGHLSREACAVYEALLNHGPLNTIRLRREARLSSQSAKSPFERALVTLQQAFMILPVGVAAAGAWRYSHVYACVHHWYPALPAEARTITRSDARDTLLKTFFTTVGAATPGMIAKTFGWRPVEIESGLRRLQESRVIDAGVRLPGNVTGYALASLVP